MIVSTNLNKNKFIYYGWFLFESLLKQLWNYLKFVELVKLMYDCIFPIIILSLDF